MSQQAPQPGDGRDVILDLIASETAPTFRRRPEDDDWWCEFDRIRWALIWLCEGEEVSFADVLLSRREQGIATYGTFLQPHNGRSARHDAIEEIADALIYLWQEHMERTP